MTPAIPNKILLHGHWMDFRGQAVQQNGAQSTSVYLSGMAS